MSTSVWACGGSHRGRPSARIRNVEPRLTRTQLVAGDWKTVAPGWDNRPTHRTGSAALVAIPPASVPRMRVRRSRNRRRFPCFEGAQLVGDLRARQSRVSVSTDKRVGETRRRGGTSLLPRSAAFACRIFVGYRRLPRRSRGGETADSGARLSSSGCASTRRRSTPRCRTTGSSNACGAPNWNGSHAFGVTPSPTALSAAIRCRH